MDPLKDLIERGIKQNLELSTPSQDDIRKYKSHVVDFIKSKKRLLYGGTAIHLALKDAGKKDGIYPTEDFDYDFYTPEAIEDSIELCNILFDAGYPMVKRIIALSGLTFRIQVNGNTDIADISYIPKIIFDKIPRLKVSGITCVHPDFMRIDFYKSLLDVPHSIYRWGQDYSRLMLINEYYPLKILRFDSKKMNESSKDSKDSKDSNESNGIDKEIHDNIIEFVHTDKTLIITGDFVYNYYIQLIPKESNQVGGKKEEIYDDYSGKLTKTRIPYFDLYSLDVEKNSKELIDYLSKNNNKDDFKVLYSAPLLKLIGPSCFVYYKDKLIAKLFQSTHRVFVYKIMHYSLKKYELKIQDYFGLLHFYNILKIHDHSNTDEYTSKIVNLGIAENKYSRKYNYRYTEKNNPFQIMGTSGMETNYSTLDILRFHVKNYIPEIDKKEVNNDLRKEYKKLYDEIDLKVNGLEIN